MVKGCRGHTVLEEGRQMGNSWLILPRVLENKGEVAVMGSWGRVEVTKV